jgi:hypothetical protein
LTSEEDIVKRLRSEIKNEIKKSQDEIKGVVKRSQDEIIEKLSEKIKPILQDYEIAPPYETLTKWSGDAINQIKKDIAKAIQENNPKQEEIAKRKAKKIDKMVDEVINLTEKIRNDEIKNKEFLNPLYPNKRILKIPIIARLRGHGRGTRNWLGLLLTGTGLGILGSGVWGATEIFFSVQGSIVIGLIILLLTAWLARRKVFALFGQE